MHAYFSLFKATLLKITFLETTPRDEFADIKQIKWLVVLMQE